MKKQRIRFALVLKKHRAVIFKIFIGSILIFNTFIGVFYERLGIIITTEMENKFLMFIWNFGGSLILSFVSTFCIFIVYLIDIGTRFKGAFLLVLLSIFIFLTYYWNFVIINLTEHFYIDARGTSIIKFDSSDSLSTVLNYYPVVVGGFFSIAYYLTRKNVLGTQEKEKIE